MTSRVLRHEDTEHLVDAAARRLLATILSLQGRQETIHLCLAGGGLANRVYARFAELVPDSGLDAKVLHLWWGDERFVPTTDPERNSLQSLSLLARTVQVSSAQTHPMPASDGHADADEAAFAYAGELGETVFDICLLGLGADGHVAALHPEHPGFEPSSALAVGVTDSPEPPSERISLTLNAINRSQRVWVWAAGADRAEAAARSLGGDASLPAGQVHGLQETLWFLDPEAAAELPLYRCSL